MRHRKRPSRWDFGCADGTARRRVSSAWRFVCRAGADKTEFQLTPGGCQRAWEGAMNSWRQVPRVMLHGYLSAGVLTQGTSWQPRAGRHNSQVPVGLARKGRWPGSGSYRPSARSSNSPVLAAWRKDRNSSTVARMLAESGWAEFRIRTVLSCTATSMHSPFWQKLALRQASDWGRTASYGGILALSRGRVFRET